MRLISSIVVMKHIHQGTQVVDSVLLVKHPEGCDPAQLINSVLGETADDQAAQIDLESDPGKGAIRDILDIDWSKHQMYIEEAPSWFVLEAGGCHELFNPGHHSVYQEVFKSYALVP
ncbi:MAG: hypothetical protein ACFFEM_15175 [Candidatus Thorarchaeota archaeon]